MALCLASTLRTENSTKKFVTLEIPDNLAISLIIPEIYTVLRTTICASINTYEPEYKLLDGLLNINRIGNCPLVNRHVARKTSRLASHSQRLREDPVRRLNYKSNLPVYSILFDL
jgi:hypothetical protein